MLLIPEQGSIRFTLFGQGNCLVCMNFIWPGPPSPLPPRCFFVFTPHPTFPLNLIFSAQALNWRTGPQSRHRKFPEPFTDLGPASICGLSPFPSGAGEWGENRVSGLEFLLQQPEGQAGIVELSGLQTSLPQSAHYPGLGGRSQGGFDGAGRPRVIWSDSLTLKVEPGQNLRQELIKR